MKSKSAIAVLCLLAGASPAFAGTTTVNFDAVPAGTDVGSFYSGVTFAPGEKALVQAPPEFPSHSGNQFLGLSSANTSPDITFSFTTPVTSLSFYYASGFAFTATALGTDGKTVLGTVNETANEVTGALTILQQVSFNTGIPDIGSVVIATTEPNGAPGLAIDTGIDDLSFTTAAVSNAPDATSTLSLLGAASVGLMAFRRKIVA